MSIKTVKWNSIPIINEENKVKKTKSTSKILNHVFFQCSELCTDEFWKDLFLTAAKGKLPKYFTYNNQILRYKKGKSVAQTNITDNDELNLTNCKKFFSENGYIYSPGDRDRINSIEEAYTDTLDNEGSKNKKNKKTYDMYINKYFFNIASTLPYKELENYKYTVLLNFNFGILDYKDIIIKDSEIVEIKNVYRDSDGYYYVDPEKYKLAENKKKYKNKKLPVNDHITKLWEKYLCTLFKVTIKEDSEL